MADSIILLEERKEVTTFLLDEGTITATTVTTPTGETPGYEYAGDKIKVDDAVTLSANSDIGKPTVKKYTAAEGEIILGIAVNDPVTMTGGRLARLFPKQEIKENSDYYTYFRQNINLDEAIKRGLLGEAKDLAPGASLQELNIRKPVTDTISIDTVGGVLNVNKDVFDSDRISFEDLLADVATLIANKIEYNIYDTIVSSAKVPKYNTTQTEDTMEAFGQFVIKALEAFKGSSGAGADLTIMVESYRTLSYIKQLAYISNKSVQPIEEIQSYYGVDNIDFLGTTHADGGSMLGEKDYIAFDIRNAPLTVLYSKSSGTTVAPITSDQDIADFYPIIEIMRKDIYDELPQYTKLFIQSKVGVLLNKPHLALTGKCRP